MHSRHVIVSSPPPHFDVVQPHNTYSHWRQDHALANPPGSIDAFLNLFILLAALLLSFIGGMYGSECLAENTTSLVNNPHSTVPRRALFSWRDMTRLVLEVAPCW